MHSSSRVFALYSTVPPTNAQPAPLCRYSFARQCPHDEGFRFWGFPATPTEKKRTRAHVSCTDMRTRPWPPPPLLPLHLSADARHSQDGSRESEDVEDVEGCDETADATAGEQAGSVTSICSAPIVITCVPLQYLEHAAAPYKVHVNDGNAGYGPVNLSWLATAQSYGRTYGS